MANTSILNAFNRFWQHTVALVGNKADRDEVVDLTSKQTISGEKTFSNKLTIGNTTLKYEEDSGRKMIVFSFK